MRFNNLQKQHVKCMMLMGMKIGEIQAVLRVASRDKIKTIAKEIGMDIDENARSTTRNIKDIKTYLDRCIKKPIEGMDIGKTQILYEKLQL